jgi:hypothetical protein
MSSTSTREIKLCTVESPRTCPRLKREGAKLEQLNQSLKERGSPPIIKEGLQGRTVRQELKEEKTLGREK